MSARRIDMLQLQRAVRYHPRGQSRRKFARQVPVGRDTIARDFFAFEKACVLDGDANDLPEAGQLRTLADEHLERRMAQQQSSSVGPWKPKIDAMSKAGVGPTVIVDFFHQAPGQRTLRERSTRRECRRDTDHADTRRDRDG